MKGTMRKTRHLLAAATGLILSTSSFAYTPSPDCVQLAVNVTGTPPATNLSFQHEHFEWTAYVGPPSIKAEGAKNLNGGSTAFYSICPTNSLPTEFGPVQVQMVYTIDYKNCVKSKSKENAATCTLTTNVSYKNGKLIHSGWKTADSNNNNDGAVTLCKQLKSSSDTALFQISNPSLQSKSCGSIITPG